MSIIEKVYFVKDIVQRTLYTPTLNSLTQTFRKVSINFLC